MVHSCSCLLKQRRTFIDSVRILARGGRGGNGLPKYGGVGGKGGDVYVEAVDKFSLANLKKLFPSQRFIAEPGKDSSRFQILGSSGADYVIQCPTGVTAVGNNCVVGELNAVGEKLLLAKGGSGGGPQNGYIGIKGQALSFTLDLKLLADIGFVGYPNAGKSTLLSALSNAQPKIASYPFTTISPNIGILCYDDFRKISAADLPGLIEGAHFNYGMGHKFLKHCLRTKVLLFVVDVHGFRLNPMSPHRNPLETIVHLNKELELYNSDLPLKPALLAINKIDVENGELEFEKLKEQIKHYESIIQDFPTEMQPKLPVRFDSIVPISAKEGTNITLLKDKIRTIIDIYQEKRLVKYIGESGDTNEPEVIYA